MLLIGHIGRICIVLLLTVAVLPAYADENSSAPIDLNITWQLSDPCLSEAVMESGIIQQLGENWQGDASMPFVIDIRTVNQKWRVNISIATAGERALTRSVSVHSCDTASRVAVILVLIALAPDRLTSPESLALLETLDAPASGTPAPAEATPATAESKPLPPEETPVPPEEAPAEVLVAVTPISFRADAPPDYDVLYSLQFTTGFGLLPSVGFGASTDVALQFNRFVLAAAISGLFPITTDIPGASGTLTSGSLTVRVFGGVAFSMGPVMLTPSIGLDMHTLFAKTEGIAQSVSANTSFFGGSFGIQGDWKLATFFGIRVAADVSVPFSRPIFEVGGVGQVHQPSAVLFFMRIGPVFIF